MLDTNVEFRKGILFIRLKGSLNKMNYNNINSLIEDFKYVVINIDKLSFIDIEGINTLIRYSKKINSKNGKLLICSSNKNNFFNKFKCIDSEIEAFNLM